MNWDISIGQGKQWYGRALRGLGRWLIHGPFVAAGERIEAGGRLQSRYGLLKHRVQWGSAGLEAIPIRPRRRDD